MGSFERIRGLKNTQHPTKELNGRRNHWHSHQSHILHPLSHKSLIGTFVRASLFPLLFPFLVVRDGRQGTLLGFRVMVHWGPASSAAFGICSVQIIHQPLCCCSKIPCFVLVSSGSTRLACSTWQRMWLLFFFRNAVWRPCDCLRSSPSCSGSGVSWWSVMCVLRRRCEWSDIVETKLRLVSL